MMIFTELGDTLNDSKGKYQWQCSVVTQRHRRTEWCELDVQVYFRLWMIYFKECLFYAAVINKSVCVCVCLSFEIKGHILHGHWVSRSFWTITFQIWDSFWSHPIMGCSWAGPGVKSQAIWDQLRQIHVHGLSPGHILSLENCTTD